MYSGDPPPSFPPAGTDQHHLPIQPNSQNQFQPPTIVDNTKAPSFTDLGNRQGNSYNQDMNINRQLGQGSYASGTGGGPLSVGDLAKGSVSETYDGVGSYYKEDKAPNLSDVDRRGVSESRESLGVVADGADVQELVGISLVGKNFRKFYPNAYYKGDDNDDDEN